MEVLSTAECQVQFSVPAAAPDQMGKVFCAIPVVVKASNMGITMACFIGVKIGFIRSNLSARVMN